MSQLRLHFLGAPIIELDGAPVEMDTRKAVALLAYLAVTGQAHSREALAAFFWPDYDQARAYANLRRTLWTLNKTLGETWLDAGPEAAGLAPAAASEPGAAGLWVDVAEFRSLLAGGGAGDKAAARHGHAAAGTCPLCLAALAEAAALYRGDFLAGFTLRDSPDFDEWQFFQAETLRRELAGVLERLAEGHAAARQWEPAIGYARRWLALDPLQEPAHRSLMRLYAAAGQRNAALRQYAECARILKEQVGASPEAETTALYERIHAGSLAPLPSAEGPIPAPAPRMGAPRANLPAQTTAFVGRSAELAEIGRLLADPACRLLTLVGPGGIGKTRLAIQAAGASGSSYADGICFVPLAVVGSPGMVAPAVAAGLGLVLSEARSSDLPAESIRVQLLDYLRGRELLLVLDNFEHLIGRGDGQADAIDLVAEMMASAPRVRLLATSRERLNVHGEWQFHVHGMAYPGLAHAAAGGGDRRAAPQGPAEEDGTLASYSAVQLFVQNARRVDPGFVPTEAGLVAIAAICRTVDGVPLAIELASTWTRLLSCAEIASEIERSLDFLAASERGLPERHRSLAAVFEHSWRLLDEEERRVFAALAVFRGGFTRDAAARVAGATLATLSSLSDKSLLHRSAAGLDPAGTRYDLHEVLKQYAAGKLAEMPDAAGEVRAQHAAYYGDLLARLESEFKGPGQLAAVARLQIEEANVRTAWDWLIENNPGELRRGLVALILYTDMRRGLVSQWEEALQPALERLRALHAAEPGGEGVAAALALALAASGNFAEARDRREEAVPLGVEAVAIARALPDGIEKALAFALAGFGLGFLPFDDASELYRSSLEIARKSGDRWGVASIDLVWADMLSYLWDTTGAIAASFDLSERIALCRKSLAAFEALGDRWRAAGCYAAMTHIARWGGDYAAAREFSLRSLALYQELGDQQTNAGIRFQMGLIAMDVGAYDEARSYFEENLAFLTEMGRRREIAAHLGCLGWVAYCQEQIEHSETCHRGSLEFYQQLDDVGGMAMALNSLGNIAQARADYAEAERLYAEGAALADSIDYGWVSTIGHRNLGKLALVLGDLPRAETELRRALRTAVGIENPGELLGTLGGWAGLLDRLGRAEDAVELLALIACHTATPPIVRKEAEQRLAELAGALPADEFATAHRRGESGELAGWLAAHAELTGDT